MRPPRTTPACQREGRTARGASWILQWRRGAAAVVVGLPVWMKQPRVVVRPHAGEAGAADWRSAFAARRRGDGGVTVPSVKLRRAGEGRGARVHGGQSRPTRSRKRKSVTVRCGKASLVVGGSSARRSDRKFLSSSASRPEEQGLHGTVQAARVSEPDRTCPPPCQEQRATDVPASQIVPARRGSPPSADRSPEPAATAQLR